MSDCYYGLNPECNQSCKGVSGVNFGVPHVGEHKILSNKQMVKLLQSSRLLKAQELIDQYQKLIRGETEELVIAILDAQSNAVQEIKKRLYGRIAVSGMQLNEKDMQNYHLMTELKFNQLKCSELSRALNSFQPGPQIKEATLQAVANSYMDNFRKELERLLKQNFNKLELGKSRIINQSSIKQQLQDSLDESGFLAQLQEQLGQGPKVKEASQNRTIINDLKSENHKGENFFDESLEYPPEPKTQESFGSSVIEPFDKKFLAVLESQVKAYENYAFQKKEPKAEQQLKHSSSVASLSTDFTQSHVDKNIGLYYVTINKLSQSEPAQFNIKVKIVKILFFRFYHEKKYNKIYKKIKFVGGDQSGIAVCFTQYDPSFKQGDYLDLRKCHKSNFFKRSLQIVSDKATRYNGDPFPVNISSSISTFKDIKTFQYDIQQYDQSWPSIGCLQYVAYSKKQQNKPLFIIANVSEIIEASNDIVTCFSHDGTGKIFTAIYLGPKLTAQMIKVGKCFYFKNCRVSKDFALGVLTLVIDYKEQAREDGTIRSSVVELKCFCY